MELADITLSRHGKKEIKAIIVHEVEETTNERPFTVCGDWHCWLRLASCHKIFVCRQLYSPFNFITSRYAIAQVNQRQNLRKDQRH